ncbi:hypothetical protein [Bifidobacterium magnum]|uniref:Uncharacterized protein n=1 Tax=Bifidobacterium magnum TaxID=1692 RepID=A0A087B997_9BIFI|nr:hypothetical protein [Bifidobacterium magnum]KFI67597.1 hypothetical protein BMAGN_0798 [Bifidobacterium magnum]
MSSEDIFNRIVSEAIFQSKVASRINAIDLNNDIQTLYKDLQQLAEELLPLHGKVEAEYATIKDADDYDSMLRVLNDKGALSRAAIILGYKKQKYTDTVLRLLRTEGNTAMQLSEAMRKYIPLPRDIF